MKLRLTIVLTAILLAASHPSWSAPAFKKRILVYLDSSGSMLRVPQGSRQEAKASQLSPFQKTLNALQLFLQEPDFVGAEDEVKVFTFGDDIVSQQGGKGPSGAAAQLAAIQPRAQQDTDFKAVLDSLQSSLAVGETFNRQLVILASDFYHEPSRARRRGDSFHRDWDRLFQERAQFLKSTFSLEHHTPVLLLAAPLVTKSAEYELAFTVRDKVVEDLKVATHADVLDIGEGGLDATDIERAIRKKLLFEPQCAAVLDQKTKQLSVEVENLNALPLSIEEIKIACKKNDAEFGGDPPALDFGSQSRRLEAQGAEHSKQSYGFSVKNLSCLGQADGFRLHLTTREGAEAVCEGKAGSWIEARLDKSRFERNLITSGNALRLTVWMKGQKEEGDANRFGIEIAGGTPPVPIAKGTFSAPDSLSPFSEGLYQFTFGVGADKFSAIKDDSSLTVKIEKNPPEVIKSKEDERGSLANGAQLFVSAIIFFVLLFAFFDRRRKLVDMLGLAADVNSLTSQLIQAFPAVVTILVPLGVNGLWVFLLERFRPWVDWIRPASIALAISFSVFFIVRWVQGVRLIRDVVEGKIDDHSSLVRRVTAVHIPFGVALAVLIVLSIVFGTLRPEPIAKGAEPVIVHEI